jgi:cystathionine beta-lyase
MAKRKKLNLKKKQNIDTIAVHGGIKPDRLTGAVMTPIYATSTYANSSPGVNLGYEYGRSQNPTREVLEDALSKLENGSKAYAFASGLSAQSAVLDLLKPGDHIIAFNDLYGGTFRLLNEVKVKSSGLVVSYIDFNSENISKHITKKTKLIWIETPTNPLLKVTDLKKIANVAKKNKILTVCDNTFATPHNQRPLEFGIDIVNHSTTKYINGHSDVIGGALIVDNNKSLQKKISFIQNSVGAVPSPFDCFLILRGIKTLGIRMKRHNENGLKIARFLKSHGKIKSVIYPGLPSHAQHKIAAKQMNGYGGMISFIHKGSLAEIKSFMKKLKIFTTAESLGGVESLIESPALMTHAYVNSSKVNIPVPENLVRISVGIENIDDLIEDLQTALN